MVFRGGAFASNGNARSILAMALPNGHPLKSRSDRNRLRLQDLVRLDATICRSIGCLNSGVTYPLQYVCCSMSAALSPPFDGVTMNTKLYRIELPRFGGSFAGWAAKTPFKDFKPKYVWLPVVLMTGVGTWMLLADYAGRTAESAPMHMTATEAAAPAQSPAANTVAAPAPTDVVASAEAIAPEETAPVDGLKISSQFWRRGGLGSNALVTLTLRNSNDYAVKDIELSCSFMRRDGSHLTDRKRVIHDTVAMRSRKTFVRLHIGYVNINAEQAECSLMAASHA
jgi:hypothetical protein